jgi:hypothetical protein
LFSGKEKDMAEKKLEDAAELRRQGAAMVSHADALEREMTLLAAAGYYDTDGNPRTGEAGRKIGGSSAPVRRDGDILFAFRGSEIVPRS